MLIKMIPTFQTGIVWLNNGQTQTSEEQQENLSWSLFPIISCLKLAGIDFKWFTPSSPTRRCLTWFICFFWFVVNTAVAFDIGIQISNPNDEFNKTTEKFSDKMSWCAIIIETGGIYVTLVFVTWQYGQEMAESLQKIEIVNILNKQTYNKLRVAALIGILLSIIEVKFSSYYLELSTSLQSVNLLFVLYFLDDTKSNLLLVGIHRRTAYCETFGWNLSFNITHLHEPCRTTVLSIGMFCCCSATRYQNSS